MTNEPTQEQTFSTEDDVTGHCKIMLVPTPQPRLPRLIGPWYLPPKIADTVLDQRLDAPTPYSPYPRCPSP